MSNKNISILFTGQGSQSSHMGLDLIEKYSWAKDRYKLSSDILGFDVFEVQSNPDKINLTEFSQPLIFIYSSILIDLFKEYVLKNIDHKHIYLAGHSLGEYLALYFADVLKYEEMLKLVHLRGNSMAIVSDPNKYGMYAVLSKSKIDKEIFNEKVFLANLNSDAQIVICGSKEDLEKFKLENQIGRYIPLNVSAPFHSPIMKESSKKFLEKAKDFSFVRSKVDIISNHNLINYKDIDEVNYASQLSSQIFSTVEWRDTISHFLSLGVNQFYEIGPKRTLLNFLPKKEEINSYPFCSFEDISKYV